MSRGRPGFNSPTERIILRLLLFDEFFSLHFYWTFSLQAKKIFSSSRVRTHVFEQIEAPKASVLPSELWRVILEWLSFDVNKEHVQNHLVVFHNIDVIAFKGIACFFQSVFQVMLIFTHSYPDLWGIFSIRSKWFSTESYKNCIFRNGDSLIINLSSSNHHGSHFIAIYILDG